MATPPIPA
ncbi:hypothetical protein YPPY113_1977, partial [Yersinia pestis PY-113]